MYRLFFSVTFLAAVTRLCGAENKAASFEPDARLPLVAIGSNGKLSYRPYTPQGDTIPDFSYCGYARGGVKLPKAIVRVTVSPDSRSTDDTQRIQAALDEVAKLPPGPDKLRGAVLLKRGAYRCDSSLKINASGVVLCGDGDGERDTVITSTSKKQQALVRIAGSGDTEEIPGTRRPITDAYVPVGASSFSIADTEGFAVGQTVVVFRSGNRAWIHEIGMDRIVPRPSNPDGTRQWEPFELAFDRTIMAIDGNRITVDVPIVCAIDQQWGGGGVARCDDSGRILNCGVEHLRAISAFDPSKTENHKGEKVFVDEDHANYLVSFDNVKHAWARNLTALNFNQGAVSVADGTKWVTVQDCAALDPISEITGGRRYAFSIAGQQILLQRCTARRARHAFVYAARVPGPNVFLDCKSEQDYATSEPHHRWSVGGLYDNVHAKIALQDRQWMGSGHGWSGANYVAWNCEGSLICQQPPTAQNFAIGFVGKKEDGEFKRPDGWWESEGRHVAPRSLYLKQLEDRLGMAAVQAAIQP